jgi:hypothetical protein
MTLSLSMSKCILHLISDAGRQRLQKKWTECVLRIWLCKEFLKVGFNWFYDLGAGNEDWGTFFTNVITVFAMYVVGLPSQSEHNGSNIPSARLSSPEQPFFITRYVMNQKTYQYWIQMYLSPKKKRVYIFFLAIYCVCVYVARLITIVQSNK